MSWGRIARKIMNLEAWSRFLGHQLMTRRLISLMKVEMREWVLVWVWKKFLLQISAYICLTSHLSCMILTITTVFQQTLLKRKLKKCSEFRREQPQQTSREKTTSLDYSLSGGWRLLFQVDVSWFSEYTNWGPENPLRALTLLHLDKFISVRFFSTHWW